MRFKALSLHNFIHQSLLPVEKALLPPLRSNLGLVKQFAKGLNAADEGFQHIRQMFPNLSDAKMSAGIVVSPLIKVIWGLQGPGVRDISCLKSSMCCVLTCSYFKFFFTEVRVPAT